MVVITRNVLLALHLVTIHPVLLAMLPSQHLLKDRLVSTIALEALLLVASGNPLVVLVVVAYLPVIS